MAGNSAAIAQMEEMAALMRDSGLTVTAYKYWETTGRSSDVDYWAEIAHHTAATVDIDNMLINGRSDLPGPLCNFALHDDGTWVLIASGRANHAGEGTITSSESIGVEATGPHGYPDTYGPAAFHNYAEYEVGSACILAVLGGEVGDLYGHKETARPLGRKIDPYFDMGKFRSGVAAAEEMEDELSAEDVAEGLKRFWNNGGVISGQDSAADGWRVINDKLGKVLAESQKSNQLLGQLVEALAPAPAAAREQEKA